MPQDATPDARPRSASPLADLRVDTATDHPARRALFADRTEEEAQSARDVAAAELAVLSGQSEASRLMEAASSPESEAEPQELADEPETADAAPDRAADAAKRSAGDASVATSATDDPAALLGQRSKESLFDFSGAPKSRLLSVTEWGEGDDDASLTSGEARAFRWRWALATHPLGERIRKMRRRPQATPQRALFWADPSVVDLLNDPAAFSAAVWRNGFADYLLPVDLSEPDGFAFGPEGFWPELAERLGGAESLWADQWRKAFREAARKGNPAPEISPPPGVDWSEAAALEALGAPNPDFDPPKLRERARETLASRKKALSILAFLAGAGCQLAVLKALWGEETLQMALLEALVVGRHERLGVSSLRALQRATRSRLLPSQFALPALALRKAFEMKAERLEEEIASKKKTGVALFSDRADAADPLLAAQGPFFDDLAPEVDAKSDAAARAAAQAAEQDVDLGALEALLDEESSPIDPFAKREGPKPPPLGLGAFRSGRAPEQGIGISPSDGGGARSGKPPADGQANAS
jgi:hypothetical protein